MIFELIALFTLKKKIPESSTLYKLLNSYKKGKVKFQMENSEIQSDDIEHSSGNKYTFKNIGFAIQYLVKDLFTHKFTRAPFSIINYRDCKKIIKDTDKYGKVMSFNAAF